jgi:cytoplasmic iron level regulating protein YaaA (DUF328/UPF0246 family)
MISVISPAKTLDFESNCPPEYSLPRLHNESLELIDILKKKSSEDIQKLMGVSEAIGDLNVHRYNNFTKGKKTSRAKQSIYAFKGDVYLGLKAEELSETDMAFAQDHLRILSGLYGLLRPLDLMQPYRLEMGARLGFDDYTSLYNFWQDKIVKLTLRDLKAQGDKVIINLASNEYFKSIDRKSLKAKVIDIEFKDFNNGEYKVVSFFAKKARGMMARYIIDNKLNKPEELVGFDSGGYFFDQDNSTDSKMAFKRG